MKAFADILRWKVDNEINNTPVNVIRDGQTGQHQVEKYCCDYFFFFFSQHLIFCTQLENTIFYLFSQKDYHLRIEGQF
jgi:hypothetical protein